MKKTLKKALNVLVVTGFIISVLLISSCGRCYKKKDCPPNKDGKCCQEYQKKKGCESK